MLSFVLLHTYIIHGWVTANSSSTHNSKVFISFSIIDKDLSYDHLASGLKEALENDKSAFDADRLQKYTGNLLFSLIIMPWFGVLLSILSTGACTGIKKVRK